MSRQPTELQLHRKSRAVEQWAHPPAKPNKFSKERKSIATQATVRNWAVAPMSWEVGSDQNKANNKDVYYLMKQLRNQNGSLVMALLKRPPTKVVN